jgi:hypothetical protein
MPETPRKKYPTLDPATDCCLYRSLRHNPGDGTRRERGRDLMARSGEAETIIFYFRHWTWNPADTNICQITSRDEAVRFIREQFTQPGLFSGWNHKGIHEFLPEVYRKE